MRPRAAVPAFDGDVCRLSARGRRRLDSQCQVAHVTTCLNVRSTLPRGVVQRRVRCVSAPTDRVAPDDASRSSRLAARDTSRGDCWPAQHRVVCARRGSSCASDVALQGGRGGRGECDVAHAPQRVSRGSCTRGRSTRQFLLPSCVRWRPVTPNVLCRWRGGRTERVSESSFHANFCIRWRSESIGTCAVGCFQRTVERRVRVERPPRGRLGGGHRARASASPLCTPNGRSLARLLLHLCAERHVERRRDCMGRFP